ncbi:hypothetical protein Cob_v007768 [Colletotrichum orbiculare MAFF 240422]|uniref:Uncharacterized protein n=1 Tax=Colletotrichum orbiculare (strain 104-T / ATCC 96160 / CBS 514.97 / LARS 414 / MAFF 240422) TaxID=1213857 RepID=N4V3N3_COLOR|nr:hypothetical protein Cob_v007768 [Colletotrichum orbiculare MAFF 240422]
MLPSSPWAAALLLASAVLPPAFVKADDCTVDPLVLPIKNVTFPNGIGANRGVKLTLGGQTQGMRMSTILNNTRVRNVLDCPDQGTSAFIGCQGASGSVYDTSKTFSQVYNIKDWNVTIVDAQPYDDGKSTVLHGYDTANFTDWPAVIYGYPFEVWGDFDSMNKSALALGPDSSTIDLLVKHRIAPTSSFSMDYGSTSELYPRDGQIIFGGVNEARLNASGTSEFNMWGAGAPVPCPLQVLISDITLTNDDGEHSLFSDVGTRVSACIDTVQNDFTLTPNMFARFQNHTGHNATYNGTAFAQSTYPASLEGSIGTLTIRLANGYTTVIPHYELVSHERGTDARGRYGVLNTSHVSAAVGSGVSDLGNNVPILGGVYLSQNHLTVDYGAGKFWLSPQVANGSLPDRVTTLCNGTTTASRSSAELGLKVGVPVVVGAAVVGLVVLWFWLKNRRKNDRYRHGGATGAGGRAIPRSEKRDAPDSKSSTTQFAGYQNYHHANPGEEMELEGSSSMAPGPGPGPGPQQLQGATGLRRAELEEPAPAYSRASEWPRMNSIQGGDNVGSYYYSSPPRGEQPQPHFESYELADTSPSPPPVAVTTTAAVPRPPARRQDTVVSVMSDTFAQSPTALRKQVSNISDVVSPTSIRTNSTRIPNPHQSPIERIG